MGTLINVKFFEYDDMKCNLKYLKKNSNKQISEPGIVVVKYVV